MSEILEIKAPVMLLNDDVIFFSGWNFRLERYSFSFDIILYTTVQKFENSKIFVF